MLSIRRIKILIKNILSMPWRLKNNVALSAILQDACFEKKSRICNRVKFYRSSIGSYSYVGPNSFVSDVKIGRYSSISQDCYIGGADHPIEWVGTSLHFYCTKKEEEGTGPYFPKKYFNTFKQTTIGNDVWIGARVIVLAGVNVADGAVIGAGSVVTKDIGPYEIWAGNPARFIRKRFDDETIGKMGEAQWWNWSKDKIKENITNFDEPKKFIEEAGSR